MDKSSTASVRRTQAERRGAAQQKLVEATMAVICEEGVSAATFEAIGRRAGYSRGLATQHFGSKQGLIEAVVDYLHERQEAAMEVAHLGDLDGLSALVLYVREYGAQFERRPELHSYFMLVSDAVADLQETRGAFAASHERVKALLSSLIRRGQCDGAIRADVDADGAALMTGCLLLGASMQALVDPDLTISPVCDQLADILLRSLAATEPGGDAR